MRNDGPKLHGNIHEGVAGEHTPGHALARGAAAFPGAEVAPVGPRGHVYTQVIRLE